MVPSFGTGLGRMDSTGRMMKAQSMQFPKEAEIVNLPPGSRTLPSFFAVSKTAGGKKIGAAERRALAQGQLEIADVRGLAGDGPNKGSTEVPKNPHDAMMQRLKSRAARAEAESAKAFLAAYRSDKGASSQSEAHLDNLIKNASNRSEDLKRKSEELQLEAAEAERKLEKANALPSVRATDAELQSMNAFERSQRRIQEDKREEEISRQREEVQANYGRVHRKLQNELIELRDFKVLLRELRRMRLEKLHDQLGRITDGRVLRRCVKEMIRHGAPRVLQKLEGASLPLETWMLEVLVNCAHVEIRIEDAEDNLLRVRRKALHPVKTDIEAMLTRTKQERFDNLCTRTWESRGMGSTDDFRHTSSTLGTTGMGLTGMAGLGMTGMSMTASNSAPSLATTRAVISEPLAQEIKAAEANIAALRRLLADMRHNAAAVICNQVRQVEKGGGSDAKPEAFDHGFRILSLLVSDDFAKATMKELSKSGPQSGLTM